MDAFIIGSRAVAAWTVTGTGSEGEKVDYRLRPLEFRHEKIPNNDTVKPAGPCLRAGERRVDRR